MTKSQIFLYNYQQLMQAMLLHPHQYHNSLHMKKNFHGAHSMQILSHHPHRIGAPCYLCYLTDVPKWTDWHGWKQKFCRLAVGSEWQRGPELYTKILVWQKSYQNFVLFFNVCFGFIIWFVIRGRSQMNSSIEGEGGLPKDDLT